MFCRIIASAALAIGIGGSASAMSISQDFNNGMLNGFSVINLGAGSIVTGGPDGASDPYLSVVDTGSAFMAVLFNDDWTGDLSAFDGGTFSVDFIQTDQANGGYIESFGELRITGGGRTIGADVILEDPTDMWQSASAVLTAELFGVTQGQFEETLASVTSMNLRAESWSNPSEIVGFDNLNLTIAPVPLPAGGLLLLTALGGLALRRAR